MKESREIRILVGKRTYGVKTILDDETMTRLEALIADACPKARHEIEQENLLMLTCLQLSYVLDKTAGALSSLLERLREDQEPQKEKND